ncbi:electron transport complex subunit RsxG [Motilimonas cestriensis]|uniref:Ion-translocating oxidoreductase complex subunit G n=1 Tax=Motilimonas cestriensis TaxID=2742685 RepID=A0ABS8WGG5_9GAMM|nr:electron transport complex subunit RsxG [Motilimonas cestriensis]MCE2596808.1 electron transport complex subunit RsxG [Motilimonas cestriensis]
MMKSISKNGLTLGVFAVVSTALVAVTSALTKPMIDQQIERQLISNISELIPADQYNNDLFASCFYSQDPHLGTTEPQQTWLALKDQQPVGLAIEAIAPNGYNGNIRLLVGIWYDGTVAGVRALEHKETPGLGDKIDLSKSNWITHFSGLTVESEADKRWAVKKDGGQFDAFTGATITPRAVVQAVRNAVLFYQLNKDNLYQQSANCGVKS